MSKKTLARSSAVSALDHWVIKSESDTDRVYMLVDFRGTELGALPENAGLEAQFYVYEAINLIADEYGIIEPHITTTLTPLHNWRSVAESIIGGAIGAIIVLVLAHYL